MRREYSLPNCTLSIEGLGNENALNTQDTNSRPLLSTLMEVECKFMSVDPSLKGGKAFFDALLYEVNRYTQSFLSGINHPSSSDNNSVNISLEFIPEKNLHLLMVKLTENTSEPIILELNTIQLFDLVEILDQLLADPQTLPDINFELQPLSRRYRIAEESLAKQAAPAALGLSSLAIVGLVFFFLLPVPPKVEDPKLTANESIEEVSENDETEESDNTEESDEIEENDNVEEQSNTNVSISSEEIDTILNSAPEIEDVTELDFIKRHLFKTIDTVWQDRDDVEKALEYSVTVTKDGSIIDFEPLEGTSPDDVEKTPLSDLRYLPTNGGQINKEEIAKFKVVFNKNVLQINPLNGSQGVPGFGPEITNKNQLKTLTKTLKSLIVQDFEEGKRFSATLQFRVGMTEDGKIGDYVPQNQKAINYENETPLPQLLDPEAAGIIPGGSLVPQEPLGQFKVIFYPNGKVEVSPWRGY